MIYENITIPLWNALKEMTGKSVLDVGCGTGALGELLQSNGNRVEGITSSSDEARIAADRLDQVHLLDLNQLSQSNAPFSGPFDALVFGDVLEHLLDPMVALRILLRFLAPGGRVYVSLPNVACFYVRFGLLCGQFKMSGRGGILDETHLHFYTRGTARRMLEQAGLTVERTDFMPGMSVWLYQLATRAPREPSAPIRDNSAFQFYTRRIYPVERLVTACWPGMLANQFVFTCRQT
jgi:SAM-dependent methyltransferase